MHATTLQYFATCTYCYFLHLSDLNESLVRRYGEESWLVFLGGYTLARLLFRQFVKARVARTYSVQKAIFITYNETNSVKKVMGALTTAHPTTRMSSSRFKPL